MPRRNGDGKSSDIFAEIVKRHWVNDVKSVLGREGNLYGTVGMVCENGRYKPTVKGRGMDEKNRWEKAR